MGIYLGLLIPIVVGCNAFSQVMPAGGQGVAGSNPVNPTSNLEQVIGETGGLLFYAQRRERIPSEALTLPMGCVATCGHRVTNAEKAG